MREFGRGVRTLIAGFGWWRHHPGVMAAGLIPAAIVGLVLAGALVGLGFALPGLLEVITPFADTWDPPWADLLRWLLAIALMGGAIVLAITTFAALTLVVGEPFYDRIWRSVERDLGGSVPDAPYGIGSSIGDALGLFGKGLLSALCAGLVALVPVVGGVAGAVIGALLNGRVIADELASRGLTARGLDASRRAALLKGSRTRVLGFGVAVHVCFLVPGAAIVVMPAAVAGAAILGRHLAGEPTAVPAAAPTSR
ncbi:EI24 domain-containing protein [Microbacterium sp. JZ31]|uniref:EI24 domain-containing protein n=1 Tax=Microbacterium sp. JZ31 TaxID=1906274 RepID=UPI001EE4DCF6|nr:EI24 domain-containing protein [Microbacterium sp. JZ31]